MQLSTNAIKLFKKEFKIARYKMFRQIFWQNRFKNVFKVDSLLNMSELEVAKMFIINSVKAFFLGLRDNCTALTHFGKIMIK
jgi:hypothetical protein